MNKSASVSNKGTDGLKQSLSTLRDLDGFIAAAVADASSGMMIGSETVSNDFNVEVAAAANTEVVKAKNKAMRALKLDGNIEDILITLDAQYHLIHPTEADYTFLYLVLAREHANLALARLALARAAEQWLREDGGT